MTSLTGIEHAMTQALFHCEHTRTIVFVRNGAENPLPVSEFVRWLKRYDSWFKACVLEGNRLSYLYNRSISLSVQDLSIDDAYVHALGSAARDLGFGVLVNLRACEISTKRQRFEHLCDSGFVSTVFIDGRDLGDPVEIIPSIMHLLDQKVGLILFGTYDDWCSTGLFESPKLNETTFSFIPLRKSQILSAHNGQSRSLLHLLPPTAPMRLLPKDAPQLAPSHEFDPCSSRVQMTVTEEGSIYPCQGSVGEESLRFGTVDDDPGVLISRVDMAALIKRGPMVKLEPGTDTRGLPDVCAAHRIALMSMTSTV